MTGQEGAVDENSLTPFVNALRRVFDVAFQVGVETTDPSLVEPSDAEGLDVSAEIVMGGAIDATLVLEFSRPTAQRLVGLFSGLEVHEQTGADIRDAIGEIASMVAGNAKVHFGDLEVRSSTPRVEMDRPRALPARDSGPRVTCLSDCGDFTLRLVPPRPRATITTRTLSEAISR